MTFREAKDVILRRGFMSMLDPWFEQRRMISIHPNAYIGGDRILPEIEHYKVAS